MKIFDIASQYLKESTWKTIAALKLCLFSMGVIVGMLLPQSHKAIIIAVCAFVFLITYIPLMRKLVRIFKSM